MDTFANRMTRVRMLRNVAHRRDLFEGREHDLSAEEAAGFVAAHLAEVVSAETAEEPADESEAPADEADPPPTDAKPTRTRRKKDTPTDTADQ